jgi:hypothetical protein
LLPTAQNFYNSCSCSEGQTESDRGKSFVAVQARQLVIEPTGAFAEYNIGGQRCNHGQMWLLQASAELSGS